MRGAMAHRRAGIRRSTAALGFGLRRQNATAWRRNGEGKHRGNGEETVGFIAMLVRDHGVH